MLDYFLSNKPLLSDNTTITPQQLNRYSKPPQQGRRPRYLMDDPQEVDTLNQRWGIINKVSYPAGKSHQYGSNQITKGNSNLQSPSLPPIQFNQNNSMSSHKIQQKHDNFDYKQPYQPSFNLKYHSDANISFNQPLINRQHNISHNKDPYLPSISNIQDGQTNNTRQPNLYRQDNRTDNSSFQQAGRALVYGQQDNTYQNNKNRSVQEIKPYIEQSMNWGIPRKINNTILPDDILD